MQRPAESIRAFATLYVIASVWASVLMLASIKVYAQEAPTEFRLGTAGINGVYYPAGVAICNAMNAANSDQRCQVVETLGSKDNIAKLSSGELNAAIVQSDLLYAAYRQSGAFSGRDELENLRTIFALHDEVFTVVARKDAGIETLDDLEGKRINIGQEGTGHREIWRLISTLYDWNEENFEAATQLSPTDMEKALCNNELDAYFIMVGHPNALVQRTLSACDAELVPVSDFVLGAILNTYPFYSEQAIRPGIYNNTDRVNTFGTTAIVVTLDQEDDQSVSQLIEAVIESLTLVRQQHPALASVRARRMARGGTYAPFHQSAQSTLRGLGLLRE